MVTVVFSASVLGLLALAGVFGGARGHRRPSPSMPADGTLVRARGYPAVYVVKGGAKFEIRRPERPVFGYARQHVRPLSAAALAQVPNVPREGSLVRPYGSSSVWRIRRGRRLVATPPSGVDVTIIPRTGLDQIPVPGGGRRTSITTFAPGRVQEGRSFRLAAVVRSPQGVPRGACFFYRIRLDRLKEVASEPTRSGRCDTSVRVTGLLRVGYSVHFVAKPPWRSSTTATRVIAVVPR